MENLYQTNCRGHISINGEQGALLKENKKTYRRRRKRQNYINQISLKEDKKMHDPPNLGSLQLFRLLE